MTTAYNALKEAVFEALNNSKENGYAVDESIEQEAIQLMDYDADIPNKVQDLLKDLIIEWLNKGE